MKQIEVTILGHSYLLACPDGMKEKVRGSGTWVTNRRARKGRKTIVFCSTVAHAEDVARAFGAAGISSVVIHGELPAAERKAHLTAFERGPIQVVVNPDI